MAGNYDSMVFGPGNGDTVCPEKSVRACDTSDQAFLLMITPLCCRDCSHADGRALESIRLKQLDESREDNPTARQKHAREYALWCSAMAAPCGGGEHSHPTGMREVRHRPTPVMQVPVPDKLAPPHSVHIASGGSVSQITVCGSRRLRPSHGDMALGRRCVRKLRECYCLSMTSSLMIHRELVHAMRV